MIKRLDSTWQKSRDSPTGTKHHVALCRVGHQVLDTKCWAWPTYQSGHALLLGLGYLWCRRQSTAEAQAPMDEWERAIEYRGTRAAYVVLMAGIILVGCMLPFTETGWSLVNTALLMIILAEVVHDGIVATSHRRQAA